MILLIGNYPNDRQESMQRFANLLKDELTKAGKEVQLIAPKPFFGRIKPSAHGLGKWLGYLDKFLIFPLQLRFIINAAKKQFPSNLLVHVCDHSSAPYCHFLQDVPHLVTCHDVLALRSAQEEIPENPTSRTGKIYQTLILKGLRNAHHIACVSEETQRQLLLLSGFEKSMISIIENGLNYPYTPMKNDEATNLIDSALSNCGRADLRGRPFILHVGGNQWYKNRSGVIRIFSELKRRGLDELILLLIGKPLPKILSHELKNEKDAAVITDADSELLRALYSKAELLLFPSLQEGFGWPIVEAQACGCRVATSDRPPMSEIAGKGAALIDPQNIEHSAEMVKSVIVESADRKEQRLRQGFENCSRFSTARMIEGYLGLYTAMLANHKSVTA